MTSCTFVIPINTRTLRYNYDRQRRATISRQLNSESPVNSVSHRSCSLREPRSEYQGGRRRRYQSSSQGYYHCQRLRGPQRDGFVRNPRLCNHQVTGWGYLCCTVEGQGKLSSTRDSYNPTLVLMKGVSHG